VKRVQIGDRFGMWEVIGGAASKKVGRRQYNADCVLCRCDCGNEREVMEQALLSGHSRSCGCVSHKPHDLTGKRFGRVLVIKKDTPHVTPGGQRKTKWKCLCDCGQTVSVMATNLVRGKQVSCGCYISEVGKRTGKQTIKYAIDATRTHNNSHTRLYNVWCTMKSRIHNPNNKSYPIYGGRGIKICPEWENDFPTFKAWAMENGYNEEAPYGECTIDRIDVNGDYCPENCRFISQAEQNRNRRHQKKQVCS